MLTSMQPPPLQDMAAVCMHVISSLKVLNPESQTNQQAAISALHEALEDADDVRDNFSLLNHPARVRWPAKAPPAPPVSIHRPKCRPRSVILSIQ